MKAIATFFTLYWCVYFPTCIAYNDLRGFSYVDEYMTAILVLFTLMVYGRRGMNMKPMKEFMVFCVVLLFYTIFGLTFGANPPGVWLDFIQELRPYSIIYCTWILNPQLTKSQKHLMLGVMVATLLSWIWIHPETTAVNGVRAEFPVLGQLAITTGMSWYLFTEKSRRNKYIAVGLVMTGLLAPKFKFLGELVCFIYVLFYMRKRLNFKSPRTVAYIVILMALVLTVTWERFDAYYITGWSGTGPSGRMARPETYKTAIRMLWDYFPFGSGMGSFACNGAWKHYSPLYHQYNLDTVWGLDAGGGFICDAYYPTLAQFGVVGLVLFIWFWKRRLTAFNKLRDMRYYHVAWITFFCLAIEQTADSSWLSGKGMGYCMLIGLCLNANRNIEEMKKRQRLIRALKVNRHDDDSQVDNKGQSGTAVLI